MIPLRGHVGPSAGSNQPTSESPCGYRLGIETRDDPAPRRRRASLVRPLIRVAALNRGSGPLIRVIHSGDQSESAGRGVWRRRRRRSPALPAASTGGSRRNTREHTRTHARPHARTPARARAHTHKHKHTHIAYAHAHTRARADLCGCGPLGRGFLDLGVAGELFPSHYKFVRACVRACVRANARVCGRARVRAFVRVSSC